MKIDRRRWKDAIAYRRVSTEEQGASGVGLEGQLAAIEMYASLDKFRITEHFQDVGTGRGRRNLADRPGLQAAIDLAKAKGLPILVSDFDRISREAKTSINIVRDYGITIISTHDGAMRNPVIIASQAARAEQEGKRISERTRESLARKKDQGVLLGNRTNLPEARKIAIERRKEIAEQTVCNIRIVLEEFPDQKISDSELVDLLNKRRILTSTKREWTVAAVRRPAKAARRGIEEDRAARDRYTQNPSFGRY